MSQQETYSNHTTSFDPKHRYGVEHIEPHHHLYPARPKRNYIRKPLPRISNDSKKIKKTFVCREVIGKNKRTGEPIFCNKIFNERGNLQVHHRIHSGERPYKCQYCPKQFTTIGNRNDHERRHNQDKPYACNFCSIKYYRKYQLTRHINRKHGHADTHPDAHYDSGHDDSQLASTIGTDNDLLAAGDQYQDIVQQLRSDRRLLAGVQSLMFGKKPQMNSAPQKHQSAIIGSRQAKTSERPGYLAPTGSKTVSKFSLH